MRVFLTLVLFLLISVPAFGRTIYVDGNNSAGPWLGTLDNPYRYIDNDPTPGVLGALAAALNGDLILVRPGTYVENLDFRGKAVTVRSDADFNETTLDFDAKATIVDGDQAGPVAIFDSGEGEDSVLWGFTLTNGSGAFMDPYHFGGGVYVQTASPKIKYCIIRDNNNVDMGGGIYCYYYANPVFLNCAVAYNSATGYDYGYGGGIACRYMSSPIIVNCTFTLNTAQQEGGGLWAYHMCEIEVYNTIFTNDSAPLGTEIYLGTSYYPSNLTIKNSVIEDNATFVALNCTMDQTSIQDDDPKLRNPGQQDFRLTTNSFKPCINKGDNEAPYVEELISDLDGDSHEGFRAIEGITAKLKGNLNDNFIIDVGCDEFRPQYVPKWYSTINEAIASTVGGNYVTILEGTYQENLVFDLGNPVILQSSVDEKASTADYAPETTILDGGQIGPVIYSDVGGTGQESKELYGFTITNGLAANGGGAQIKATDFEFDGCIFTNNHATENGGAIYGGYVGADNSKITLRNCTVEDNSAELAGGAIYLDYNGARSVFNLCTFTRNTAGTFGGVVAGGLSDFAFSNSEAYENSAPLAPVIYMDLSTNAQPPEPGVNNNFIYHNPTATLGNQPAQAGGAVYIIGDPKADPFVHKNVIYENSALMGGAIYCEGSKLQLEDNMIYRNWAENGGGIAIVNSLSTTNGFSNNNFYKNQATVKGGGFYWTDVDDMHIANMIIRGNTAPENPQVHMSHPDARATFCNIEGGAGNSWYDATNCIDLDPRWVNSNDPSDDTFLTLDKTSPCINRGSNDDNSSHDFFGTAHNKAGTADIGSHEFDGDLLLSTSLKDKKFWIIMDDTPDDVEFYLAAGEENAGRRYYLLISVTGSLPGTVVTPGGETLPMNWDVITDVLAVFIIYQIPPFDDFTGNLDANGEATAIFETGLALSPETAGATLTFAYTLAGPGTAGDLVSNPLIAPIYTEAP